jgi:hypothetical protein
MAGDEGSHPTNDVGIPSHVVTGNGESCTDGVPAADSSEVITPDTAAPTSTSEGDLLDFGNQELVLETQPSPSVAPISINPLVGHEAEFFSTDSSYQPQSSEHESPEDDPLKILLNHDNGIQENPSDLETMPTHQDIVPSEFSDLYGSSIPEPGTAHVTVEAHAELDPGTDTMDYPPSDRSNLAENNEVDKSTPISLGSFALDPSSESGRVNIASQENASVQGSNNLKSTDAIDDPEQREDPISPQKEGLLKQSANPISVSGNWAAEISCSAEQNDNSSNKEKELHALSQSTMVLADPTNSSHGEQQLLQTSVSDAPFPSDIQNAIDTPPMSSKVKEVSTVEYENKILSLQSEVTKAHAVIETLHHTQVMNTSADKFDILIELQSKLQEEMSLKAEAENRARLTELQNIDLLASNAANIEKLEALEKNLQFQMSAKAEAENKARLALDQIAALELTNEERSRELERYRDLEVNLQKQMESKGEAENSARLALERIDNLEKEKDQQQDEIIALRNDTSSLKEVCTAQEQELEKLREERNEQHRKEMALTNRLNGAKKKEADKANLAELYEEDIQSYETQLAHSYREREELTAANSDLKTKLDDVEKTLIQRVRLAESSLADERSLNEERKRKMKAFVETRAEELRQAKTENDQLQNELNDTNRSLVELNNRSKQLHAQWVQAQTRNRELQRDVNKTKKEYENFHKVGGTHEVKPSRSVNETDENKNKRLAAKHELMNVLRQLEIEKDAGAKLRDSIKFTFTPKALSQQQLLRESLSDLEAQLSKLSLRLGKPLLTATTTVMESIDVSEGPYEDVRDPQHLVTKLDFETQRVSKGIMDISSAIERMQMTLDASGDRSCFTAFSEILSNGNSVRNTSVIPGAQRLNSIRSHSYGHVPRSALN